MSAAHREPGFMVMVQFSCSNTSRSFWWPQAGRRVGATQTLWLLWLVISVTAFPAGIGLARLLSPSSITWYSSSERFIKVKFTGRSGYVGTSGDRFEVQRGGCTFGKSTRRWRLRAATAA